MKSRSIFTVICAIALVLMSPAPATQALEFLISENGSGSSNQAVVNDTSTTSVTQQNDTSVNNDVAVISNTGGNQANENEGDVTIQTGDSTTNINIATEANQSTVSLTDPCCGQNSTINISGNGTASSNDVNLATSQNTTVNVIQFANIHNQTDVSANTGNNQASGNGGDVTIISGDIFVDSNTSTSTNLSDIEICCTDSGSLTVTIKDNGAGSSNTVNFTNENNVFINTFNYANIMNTSVYDLNTGNNITSDNLGNVWIHTGDITLTTDISTITNQSEVKISDCNPEPETETQPPTIPPTTPPAGGTINQVGTSDGTPSSDSNDNSQLGGILGVGDVLPATGSQLIWLLLINALLFLLGGYLRLRSGRSPAIILRVA